MSLTASERSLRARLGAFALHARRDARETTAAARAAFASTFERQVDPAGKLDARERARRAEAARRAHFARLALRSALVRKVRAGQRTSRPKAARAGRATRPVIATEH